MFLDAVIELRRRSLQRRRLQEQPGPGRLGSELGGSRAAEPGDVIVGWG